MDAAAAFRLQAEACASMDSPLYATLLIAAADDIEAGGVVGDLVAGWSGEPRDDALGLRLMGATHLLALDGSAPTLAEHYPSCGGRPRGTVAAVFLRTVSEHLDRIRSIMQVPPQTNEVGRAAIILGGLLEIVGMTDLPISLNEVGAAAGLNLYLDHYRYELGDQSWGDPASEVTILSQWSGDVPATDRPIAIVARRGCDRSPLDITDRKDSLRLQAYVWPDHDERRHRMRSAIRVARANPVSVERADAVDWVVALAPQRDQITVVYHTVVLQYLEADSRQRFARAMRRLGERATQSAPLAWLRFEPGQHTFELRLTLFPSGVDLVLCEAQPHGSKVSWLAR